MRSQLTTTIATYGLLGAAAAVSFMLPSSLGPRSSSGAPTMTGATTMDVTGIIHDFKSGHPDFKPGLTATGHYAGNVATNLSATGSPSFVGVLATPLTNFTISNSTLRPQKPFAAMITVIWIGLCGELVVRGILFAWRFLHGGWTKLAV